MNNNFFDLFLVSEKNYDLLKSILNNTTMFNRLEEIFVSKCFKDLESYLMGNSIRTDILFLLMIISEANNFKEQTLKQNEYHNYETYSQFNLSLNNMTLSTRIQSHLNTNSINNHFIENKPNLKSEKNRELFEKKLSKINSACLHTNKIHYAKNMCKNCYHSKGREKKAWKCIHKNKSHYAKGLCQNCYQFNNKREKKIVFSPSIK